MHACLPGEGRVYVPGMTSPEQRATSPSRSMRAWAVMTPGPIHSGPLVAVERPVPAPGPGQVRIRVLTCGVCRTDLHLAEGDVPARRPGVTPGHEVVGVVDELGPGCELMARGDRIGAAWLASTCGRCRFCRSGQENLCLSPRFTGWDLDGGFAEYLVADERFCYRLPEDFDDVAAAPLLCAGIIGFRALRLAGLPEGGELGLWGFGGSAHLAAQVALSEGARVHVRTRAPEARLLALDLGASSVGDSADGFDRPLDAAILFAPAGELVPLGLRALDRGGTLAIAGIHLSQIPPLDYQAELFEERVLRSVTANTRQDGEDFLAIAATIGLRPTTTVYGFDQVATALEDLAQDRFSGAAVIRVADR